MNKTKMASDFSGWGQDVQRILSLMQKPDLWALFDFPPASTYVGINGGAVVMGDAAHAR